MNVWFPALGAVTHEKSLPRGSKIRIWDGPRASLNIWENTKTNCRYQDLNQYPSLDHLWNPLPFRSLKLEEY